MATDKLTGNMNTELMVDWLDRAEIIHGLDEVELNQSLFMAGTTFPAE